MSIYESAGIAEVRLNEIVAFTPTASTLQRVEATLRQSDAPGGGWTRLTIGDRLYLEGDAWEVRSALPSRSRSNAAQVLWRPEGEFALRLVKDGTSTVTRIRSVPPEELVADINDGMPKTKDFVIASLGELGGVPPKNDGWGGLAMDEWADIALPLDLQPPYPVSEVEVVSEERLRLLLGDSTDLMQGVLDRLLIYLVARNYRLDQTDGVGLEELCGEVLIDVLDDGFLLRDSEGGKRLRNLSQGTRAFIAFGRRGTVVVHARSVTSLPIRCSVLTMVETLRSRFHNLLVASSLMDTLLLRLAQLMESVGDKEVSAGETERVKKILDELAMATYIYGLAVTDPGVQLLDGSVISIIADRAEEYFEIQSLRHACERKMEAIRTIWAAFQDRRRQSLLRALRGDTRSGRESVT